MLNIWAATVIALNCALVLAEGSTGSGSTISLSSSNSGGSQYEADQAAVYKADQTIYKTVVNNEQSDYVGDQQDYGGHQQQGYGGGQQSYGQGGYKQEEKYPHQPYGFGYNIDDGYGNKQWRHEKSSNPHSVTGTYGYKDKNGIMREVEYIADKNGFRAMIKTTEPGTASKDPAYVKMNANPIAVEWYPPKKQQSYGKGQPQAYQEQGGGSGDQYSQGAPANNYGGGGDHYDAKAVAKYSAEGSAYTGKVMENYENEYASAIQAGSKTTMAKYQDKKK